MNQKQKILLNEMESLSSIRDLYSKLTKRIEDQMSFNIKKSDNYLDEVINKEIDKKTNNLIQSSLIKTLWTTTKALFVVGGMLGAFTSKYVMDRFGRKNGILFHYGINIKLFDFYYMILLLKINS